MTDVNYTPKDAREQIEDGDEMYWRSIDVLGSMAGQVIVLQQLVVLRDGNVLPLDAHRSVASDV